MNVQLDLFPTKELQPKDDVFYARCRKKHKQALYLRMTQDGFNSLADWFDQWVLKALEATAKGANNAASNKRHSTRRSKPLKKKRNI